MSPKVTICDVLFDLLETPQPWKEFANREYDKFCSEPGKQKIFLNASAVKDLKLSSKARAIAKVEATSPYLTSLDLAVGCRVILDTTKANTYNCTFNDLIDPKMALENFIRVFLAHYLPCSQQGLMFHGSCGIAQQQGIIFSGISGAGKTTLSDDFKKTTYLSDDISIVQWLGGEPYLVPHPFHGKSERPQAKESAPLKAICILGQQSERTSFRRLDVQEVVQMLPRHIVTYANSSFVTQKILDMLQDLVAQVPVFYIEKNLTDMSADELVEKLLQASDVGPHSDLRVA
jgi:hypothetical protein